MFDLTIERLAGYKWDIYVKGEKKIQLKDHACTGALTDTKEEALIEAIGLGK